MAQTQPKFDPSGNMKVAVQGGITATVDSEFPAAAAGADGAANQTAPAVDSRNSGFNGTTWDRLRAGITAVTATLTGWLNTLPWAIFNTTPSTRTNGQGGPLEADNVGNLLVAPTGRDADDAAVTAKPVVAGAVAVETDGTDPTSVSAEGDVAQLRSTRDRILLVSETHPRLIGGKDAQSSAQTNTSLISAPGANLSIYITDIILANGATAGTIKLVEDPAGTPADLTPAFTLAINGGLAIALKTPIRVTANKAVGYTSVTVTTHQVQIRGYVAP